MKHTLEDLQAKTDTELIELCITELFGGHKEHYERTEHFCCEGCGKCNESCAPRKEWLWRIKDGHPAYNGNSKGPWWNPLSKWEDTMEVIQRLRDDKWCISYGASGGEHGWGLSLWGEKTGGYFPTDSGTITVIDKSGQRAIVLAALLSVA